MKYMISYTEIIPRLQAIEANSEDEAVKKLNKLIEHNETDEKLTGLACDYEIVSIMNCDHFRAVGDRPEAVARHKKHSVRGY